MGREDAHIRIDPDLRDYLRELSKATGQSMSQTINNALYHMKTNEEARKAEAVTLRQIRRIIQREASRARSDANLTRHLRRRSSRLEGAQ